MYITEVRYKYIIPATAPHKYTNKYIHKNSELHINYFLFSNVCMNKLKIVLQQP